MEAKTTTDQNMQYLTKLHDKLLENGGALIPQKCRSDKQVAIISE